MADTNWGDFADRATLLDTDVLLVMDAGGGGVNVPASAITSPRKMMVNATTISNPNEPTSYPFNVAINADVGVAIGADGSRGFIQSFGGRTLSLNAAGNGIVFGASMAPTTDNALIIGGASYRLNGIYLANSPIVTSDRDEKQQIGDIPDAWLDAWTGVRWQRFKMNDAVALKGSEGARWHFGLIAQDVRDVFAAAGIDGFSIGLLCFDQWDAVTEPVMREVKRTRKVPKMAMMPANIEGHPDAVIPTQIEVDEKYFDQEDTGQTRVVREAGERYGIRYDLAQAIEAAYQRRRTDRLEAAVDALADRLAAIEASA